MRNPVRDALPELEGQLPDKKLLQAKLHEFYLQNAPDQWTSLEPAHGDGHHIVGETF